MLNNDYMVLKIPFYSKRKISKFLKKNKNSKYDFSGIAYYVFNEKWEIINNKAKLTSVEYFENKENIDTTWSEKESSKIRNKILEEYTNKEIIIKKINELIEKKNLTVNSSYSLVTGSNPAGACIGSNFNKTEILYFDEDNPAFNLWRFSTLLSVGWKKDAKLLINNEEKIFKYSKIKNNNKNESFTFNELDKMKEITLTFLLKENKELHRLFMIYNKDLLSEEEWSMYKDDINGIIKNNPKVYPTLKENNDIIASLLMKKEFFIKEHNIDLFQKITSEHRRKFRINLLNLYNEKNKKVEEIFKTFPINEVCEAAHIFDVKLIKEEIRKISHEKIEDEKKQEKILLSLKKISDPKNGIFLDPTTHKYFDMDKIVFNSNGEIVNKTKINYYDNLKVVFDEEQKNYLKLRQISHKY